MRAGEPGMGVCFTLVQVRGCQCSRAISNSRLPSSASSAMPCQRRNGSRSSSGCGRVRDGRRSPCCRACSHCSAVSKRCLGSACHGLEQAVVEPVRQLWTVAAGGGWHAEAWPLERFDLTVGIVAGEQPVQAYAGRIEILLGYGGGAGKRFRGHVAGRAGQCVGFIARQARAIGQAKVEHAQFAILAPQQVFRLDVAMHDIASLQMPRARSRRAPAPATAPGARAVLLEQRARVWLGIRVAAERNTGADAQAGRAGSAKWRPARRRINHSSWSSAWRAALSVASSSGRVLSSQVSPCASRTR